MVLKVVRGKILETWELRRLLAARGSVSVSLGRDGRPDIRPWKCCRVRLSKIEYYLVDNIYIFILSLSMGRIQEESGRTSGATPELERRRGWKRWVTTTLRSAEENPAQAELGRGTLES
jgi:hypothetical protein